MVDSVLMSLFLIKTRVSFTSNFLDQNNPKFKFLCKKELIYIRDFEAIPKTCGPVLSRLKTLGKPTFNNTLQLIF